MKIFLGIIALFFFAAVSIWNTFSHGAGSEQFNDTTGQLLISGIWICYGTAIILLLFAYGKAGNHRKGIIASFRKGEQSKMVIILLCLFTGLGTILTGCFAYGEKARFADQSVIKTEAEITFLNVGSRVYTAGYQYKDEAGNLYYGTDNVNSGATWAQLHIGGMALVNYLQSNPSVSRIIEVSNTQAYIIKAALILLGACVMLSPFFFLKKDGC